MSKQIAIVSDMTTTGGRIISGSEDSFNGNQSIACIGDYASHASKPLILNNE